MLMSSSKLVSINSRRKPGTIERRPAFEAYAARLRRRPAYLRAAEIDNGLAAQSQRACGEKAALARSPPPWCGSGRDVRS